MVMNVLVLNSGSSSLKFQIIATDAHRIRKDSDERLLKGVVTGIGGVSKILIGRNSDALQQFTVSLPDVPAALDWLIGWLESPQSALPGIGNRSDVQAVGHRVVHGGEQFSESVVITEEVLAGIQRCNPLAPLHNPHNIEGILAARRLFGEITPHVAVFDTAFHQTLPPHAYLYAVPYALYQRYRIRRYGFHGISHRYVAHRYAVLRGLTSQNTNLVSLHLGNGCSATGIRAGRSMDTSMGMTPLEGLIMGTRSGDIDPAIPGFVASKEGLTIQEVDALLNEQSGLLGVSGITNDMRALQNNARESPEGRAQLAIQMFCYRARKYIGALLAAIGGADAILFTGGIGENSPEIRAGICEGLEWAGLRLDEELNRMAAATERCISRTDSQLSVYVIPTDEEMLIARDTVRCVTEQRESVGASRSID